MAKPKKQSKNKWSLNPKKQKTSIGKSKNSRPTNKHKRRMSKQYRGQGR